ncbi:MAG TPA: PCRF domain-containing protein, partial [Candidatus Brocadiia bacterium]|nr:PCRF domain-containing protein [Candidatus Brocadiia bacterium]
MAALEERMAKEGFWEDKETAQKVIKEAQGLKQLLEPMGELGQGLEDLETLAELAKEDASAEQEFVAEMAKMEQRLRAFEFRQMMSGPMDKNNAYLSVHAG